MVRVRDMHPARRHLAEDHARLERLYAELENALIPVTEDISVTMTVSAGVAAIPSCADSLSEALRIADDRLYAAKRAGRNRVVHSDKNQRRSAA